MSDQTGTRWWNGRDSERFWLESTDRLDIGADLRAPELDGGGKPNWRYDLFKAAKVGDIVLHYDTKPESQGIVGYSTVAGPWHHAPVVWSARGTYARERGDVPVERPGYIVPLTGYTTVQTITLSALRQREGELQTMVDHLARGMTPNKALYFPFEIFSSRDIRLLQGYAWKIPAAFLQLFPELGGLGGLAPAPSGANLVEALVPVQAAGRNPPWSRDELILALDLYVQKHRQSVSHQSPEVVELSRVLNALNQLLRPKAAQAETYRNTNGVYMKLMNFRRFDTAFTAQGNVGLQRGNALEGALWSEYSDDPQRLRQVADAIRAAISGGQPGYQPDVVPDDEEEAIEGQLLTRLHRERERDRGIIQRRKKQALQRLGRLTCEACTFDFYQVYGTRGEGFIECHHTKPLYLLEAPAPTRVNDLALLCANCHRMIHAKRRWLTVDELRRLLAQR